MDILQKSPAKLCGLLDSRTSTFIVVVLNFIFWTGLTLNGFLGVEENIVHLISVRNEYDTGIPDRLVWQLILLVIAALGIPLTIVLFVGAIKKKQLLLWIWLVAQGSFIALSIGLVAFSFIAGTYIVFMDSDFTVSFLITITSLSILILAIQISFFVIVNKYRDELLYISWKQKNQTAFSSPAQHIFLIRKEPPFENPDYQYNQTVPMQLGLNYAPLGK